MKYLRNDGTFWMASLCQKGITQKGLPTEQQKAMLPIQEGFQQRFPAWALTKPNHFPTWWDLTRSQPSITLLQAVQLGLKLGYLFSIPAFHRMSGWVYISSVKIPNFLVFLDPLNGMVNSISQRFDLWQCNWLYMLPLGTRMTLSVVFHSVTKDFHSLLS